MHTGCHDGLHYAMGYCGSGVGMGRYLGMRVGQNVLGLTEGRTAFDDLAFQTRPFYSRKPWFLAASIRCYRWRGRTAEALQRIENATVARMPDSGSISGSSGRSSR